MANDCSNSDYQEGNVIAEMDVTHLANGFYKASCMGLEAHDRDQSRAVLQLQEQLQAKLLSGELRPEM